MRSKPYEKKCITWFFGLNNRERMCKSRRAVFFFFRPKKKIRQGQVWRFSENKRLDIVLYTANKLKHQSKQPILDGIHQRLNALPSFGYEPTCTQSMKTHVAFTILVFLPSVDPHSFLLVVSYLNLSFHSLTTSFDNTHTHTHTHTKLTKHVHRN